MENKTENKIKAARPYRAYLIHGFLALISLLKFGTSISVVKYLWMAVFVIAVIVLVKMLIHRYAMEVIDSKLVIRRDFAPSQEIDLAIIQSIELVDRLFASSKIILKDGHKVKFNNNDVEFKDVREMCRQLNIPVTG